MKSSEARSIAERAVSLKSPDNLLEFVKEEAEEGGTFFYVGAEGVDSWELHAMLLLGYQIQECEATEQTRNCFKISW